ncbi:uroporphyrinogen-III synthase [bacterium BMS3Bbin11]|nr:uroporphyrinogen-III synthase [bacterium BMS3Abin11]GBE46484.1 uroporphyrinogen-III synthase [bacterium BMS3Bbin11]GMT41020.1 MAG: uroporphyrinogen III methyltransferase [bacterium]HDH15909.1 uroporphyrinogen-III synthase [Gammaproteobacteria bacterium]
MTKHPLQNCTLVVTRPIGQANKLIDILENAGATVVHFPVIKITAIPEQERLLELAKQLNMYDIAIFISRNAAIYGTALLQQAGWPQNTQIAAIGNGTAQQLRTLGYSTNIVSSTTANSEGLLAEPAMHSVKGKRILIIRGNGGRGKLAETLCLRGAQIDYFECYERSRPQANTKILSRLWDRNSLNGIILTSAEGLKNLYQMVNKNDLPRLNTTPLYVISSTMVELCGKLGYKLTPVLMPSAHDEDVLESVTVHCAVKTT